MQAVEKLHESSSAILSLDEIRLCQEIQRLAKQIPFQKLRFAQINRLWQVHIATHPKERDWAANAKTEILLNHLVWVQTLQAQGRTDEELFAMIQNV